MVKGPSVALTDRNRAVFQDSVAGPPPRRTVHPAAPATSNQPGRHPTQAIRIGQAIPSQSARPMLAGKVGDSQPGSQVAPTPHAVGCFLESKPRKLPPCPGPIIRLPVPTEPRRDGRGRCGVQQSVQQGAGGHAGLLDHQGDGHDGRGDRPERPRTPAEGTGPGMSRPGCPICLDVGGAMP